MTIDSTTVLNNHVLCCAKDFSEVCRFNDNNTANSRLPRLFVDEVAATTSLNTSKLTQTLLARISIYKVT